VLHSGNSVTDSTPGNSAGVALNLNGDALLRTASYKVDTKIAARHGPANSITPIGEKLLDILLKLRTAHRVDIHDLECPELPVFDYKMNRDCGDYDPATAVDGAPSESPVRSEIGPYQHRHKARVGLAAKLVPDATLQLAFRWAPIRSTLSSSRRSGSESRWLL